MTKFEVGENVKVVADSDDPESGWVGAVGQVMIANDELYTLRIIEGNLYHDNDNTAVFRESELERYDDHGWDPVGS